MFAQKPHPWKGKLSYAEPTDPLLRKAAIHALELATGRRKLERLYGRLHAEGIDEQVWAKALEALRIQTYCSPDDLKRIPTSGGLIVIANHPFGVVDGMMICDIISQRRSDFQVLANASLCKEDWLDDYILPIDFEETKQALLTNLDTGRRAESALRAGRSILIFPGGAVSTAKKWFGPAEEFEWKLFVAKMVQRTQVPVLPMYFHGQNSRLFHIASLIHPTLRAAMLLNEVRNKVGRGFDVSIGKLIDYDQLADFKNRSQLIHFLRETVQNLAKKQEN